MKNNIPIGCVDHRIIDEIRRKRGITKKSWDLFPSLLDITDFETGKKCKVVSNNGIEMNIMFMNDAKDPQGLYTKRCLCDHWEVHDNILRKI